jgi:large subunit ribosomal protein L7/L12
VLIKGGAKVMTEEKKTKEETKLDKKMEEMIKSIESMSVLELSQLVKALEDKFGVSAAMPMMVAGSSPAQATAAAPAAEEKTTFTLVLAKAGDNKIQVIKEIRAVTNLGLKEAKDLVDQAPKPVKENASKEEAESIKKKLEAVGAVVELK